MSINAFNFIFNSNKLTNIDKEYKLLFERYLQNIDALKKPMLLALMSDYSYGGTDFDKPSDDYINMFKILCKKMSELDNSIIPDDILKTIFKDITKKTIRVNGLLSDTKIKLYNIDIDTERFIRNNFKIVIDGDNYKLQVIKDNRIPIFIHSLPTFDEFSKKTFTTNEIENLYIDTFNNISDVEEPITIFNEREREEEQIRREEQARREREEQTRKEKEEQIRKEKEEQIRKEKEEQIRKEK